MEKNNVDCQVRAIRRWLSGKCILTRKRKGTPTVTKVEPLAQTTSTIRKIQQQTGTATSERARLEFKIEVERVAVDYLEQASRDLDEERAQAALALLSEHKPLLSTLRANLRRLDKSLAINTSIPEETPDTQIVRTQSGELRVESSQAEDDEPAGMSDVWAEAFRLELDEIQDKYESGKISQDLAREMREEIYLLQMGLAE